MAESLNVSVAAGILLFEAARQRTGARSSITHPGDRSDPAVHDYLLPAAHAFCTIVVRLTLSACSITFNSQSVEARCLVINFASSASCLCLTSCTCRSQLSIKPSCRFSNRRLHAAAAIVAADDDVLHLEHVDGVLHHGKTVEVSMVHDVGNVAMHEHLAGPQSYELRSLARDCPNNQSKETVAIVA